MLQELYAYALDRQLIARPGFKRKTPKAYVCLDREGEFLGIDPPPMEAVLCPDLGSAAQGTSKCNLLVEKALISLTEEKPQKHAFFLDSLVAGTAVEPLFDVVHTALTHSETVEAIQEALEKHKIKSNDTIGYKVDGIALESLDSYRDWWCDYVAQQRGTQKTTQKERCFITGDLTVPVATVPKTSGLRAVGGHSSGDAVLCFDKNAFCSYGRSKGANAPVSESAIAAVNAALEDLSVTQKAPILAGAKWLHWYKRALPQEIPDFLDDFLGGWGEEESDTTDSDDGATALSATIATERANRLLQSLYTGEMPTAVLENEYYILALSGAGGRIMVRVWQQGTFQELHQALTAWWNELELVSGDGKGLLPRPRLGQLNARLVKPQKGGNLSEQMSKELAALEPQMILAVLNHSPLPDQVAAKALQTIRTRMVSAAENDERREPIPDARACQLLKVWLLRQDAIKKGGYSMQPDLTPDYPSAAYQCGRMMAVYAAIQSRAMGNVGAGVLQRYYTSASCTPALVLGRLSSLCQHHLAKLKNEKLAGYYENLLGEISQRITPPLPATLDLRGQSEFALGYYQQRAALCKPAQSTCTASTDDSEV